MLKLKKHHEVEESDFKDYREKFDDIQNYVNFGINSNISESQLLSLCMTLEECVSKLSAEGLFTQTDHYFRNKINNLKKVPNSLDEFIYTNRHLPNEQKWNLVESNKAVFHMFEHNGEYNVKFISSDYHFEAVYSTFTRDIVTNEGNMGTYNYSSPFDVYWHGLNDVIPYYLYGNTINDPYINILWDQVGIGISDLDPLKIFNAVTEKTNQHKLKNNPLALELYNEIKLEFDYSHLWPV